MKVFAATQKGTQKGKTQAKTQKTQKKPEGRQSEFWDLYAFTRVEIGFSCRVDESGGVIMADPACKTGICHPDPILDLRLIESLASLPLVYHFKAIFWVYAFVDGQIRP